MSEMKDNRAKGGRDLLAKRRSGRKSLEDKRPRFAIHANLQGGDRPLPNSIQTIADAFILGS
jgi:hypothetical protein